MKYLHLFLLTFLASFLFSCQSTDTDTSTQPEKPEGIVMEKDGLTLTEVVGSPEFPGASLAMNSPADEAEVEPGKVTFSYTTDNFVLGNQTADAAAKLCANSKEGQHIHLILNNAPYTAHYNEEFERELQEGAYVALSFLSRSYHESIKTKEAYVLSQFTVGPDKDEYAKADLSAPNIFYSRPKGDYLGDDTKNLLLDFYLVNTTLSEDGNKVKATINGVEFVISKWAPYFISGLPYGEVTITLELVDKDGYLIPTPFNPVTRNVMLYESEPLPPL